MKSKYFARGWICNFCDVLNKDSLKCIGCYKKRFKKSPTIPVIKTVILKCPTCRKPFIKKSYAHKFCTDWCRLHTGKQKVKKVKWFKCNQCGILIKRVKSFQMFCSSKCLVKSYRVTYMP